MTLFSVHYILEKQILFTQQGPNPPVPRIGEQVEVSPHYYLRVKDIVNQPLSFGVKVVLE